MARLKETFQPSVFGHDFMVLLMKASTNLLCNLSDLLILPLITIPSEYLKKVCYCKGSGFILTQIIYIL